MDFANYNGTALDTSMFEDVQPTTDPIETQAEPDVDPQNQVDGNVPATANDGDSNEPIDESGAEVYSLPGLGDYTIEELKEMKNGNLRQADYTKKTQELARQREELKDAENLYNYLKSNPHLVAALKQADTNPQSPVVNAPTVERQMLQQLMYNQKAMETDMKMNELKSKYGDVDELAIYQKAAELRTDDLEFVYKALNYGKQSFDREALMAEIKEQLKAELEANRNGVSTIVNTNQQTAPIKTPELSANEKRVAAAMGMTEEEYVKWNNM